MSNVPPASLSSFDEHLTEELPSDPRGYKQHVFLNLDGDKRPYLKLKLLSTAESNSLPNYAGNDTPIQGSVELDPKKPTDVKSVKVTFKGLIVNSELDVRPFLEQEEVLLSEKTEIDGLRSFPFSLSIPGTLMFDDKKAAALGFDLKPDTAYPLPPSLRSTTFSTMIDYVVSLEVKYGSFFKPDDSISTVIGYSPNNLSFETRTYNGETSGWANFESKLEGTAFDKRKVEIVCKLSLPAPVIFKRGTTVPIRLTLSSSDVEALDLLAQPDIPIAELTFRLQPIPGVQSAGSALSWRKLQEIPRVVWSNKKELEYEDEEDLSRTLEGQVDIPVNTQASLSFGTLIVYYTFDLIPLKTTGFNPSPKDFLFHIPVSIL